MEHPAKVYPFFRISVNFRKLRKFDVLLRNGLKFCGMREKCPCLSLNELLKRAALAHPEKPAIIYKDQKITYQHLDEATTRLANSFVHLGIKKGDRVGVLLPKIPETVISYLGLSKCGAIGFPINYEEPPEVLQRVLSETQPSALIVHTNYLKILQDIPHKVCLIAVGDASGNTMYSFQDLVQKGQTHPCLVSVNTQDVFYLNFTSGMTGTPKGAVTTHANIFYNTCGAIDALGLTSNDVHMCMFAVYSHPHEIFARALFLGGTLVLLNTIYPQSMAQAIEKNGVTCMMALPPFYEMLLELAETKRLRLNSLRIPESGGMETHQDLKRRFMKKFGRRIISVWGSTETTGIAIANKRGKADKENLIGTPCKYYDVRIVDDNGGELPPGQVGELSFRGSGVISRYYTHRRENETSLVGGYYFSGDLGMRDDEGKFFFLGRKFDMFKIGGWKVYPLEIETVLNSHPEIRNAAVVGIPDKKRGQIPKAVIVLERGAGLREYDIVRFCKSRLARYKIPKIIEFVEELPKLGSGKINRAALK